jgi:hypothetical protein
MCQQYCCSTVFPMQYSSTAFLLQYCSNAVVLPLCCSPAVLFHYDTKLHAQEQTLLLLVAKACSA